jgi:NADH-quinone oxidoreductase subunit A
MHLLSIKNFEQDKILPYECGFDEFSSNRNLFDVHYYIIAILFLLFDVESIYIIPWTVCINFYDFIGLFTMSVFFFFLLLGFNFEWVKGTLNWMNYNETQI